MYQYTEFDKAFVRARAAEFRDQLGRWQTGQLSEDQFRPLRLQNGWYVQRYAPMLRVAVPYGEINAAQIKVLAQIAREYDTPDAALLARRSTAPCLGWWGARWWSCAWPSGTARWASRTQPRAA